MGQEKSIIPSGFSATITRLFGALKSGYRAAYLALLIKLIKPITHLIDRISALFSHSKKTGGSIPIPIMIVSPPRGGATIIFQTLVRVLPSTYISNMHALFPRHASQWVIQRDGKISFKSKNYYGYTANLFDVYEGNEFIDPIFDDTQSSTEIKNRFVKLLGNIKADPSMPFIYKNARNYNNTGLLSKAIPEVLFIRIKRNPEQVIQSEHRAYKELKTFHPIPDSLKNSNITDPLEFNVHQILEIEREIDRQKELIKPEQWVEWEYEAFCEDPIGHISKLAEQLQIPLSTLRPERLTYKLKASSRKKVSDEEEKRISKLINVIKQD